MVENSKEIAELALEAIEVARTTGKIRKGANEATKAVEKGDAKLVVIAQNVNPKEIVMHIPIICDEKNVVCVEVPTKEELGAAAGLEVGTSAVVIVKEGDAKSVLKQINSMAGNSSDATEKQQEEKEANEDNKAEEQSQPEEKAAEETETSETKGKSEEKPE